MRETVPSSVLAIQIDPPPATTAPGPRPTRYSFVIRPPSGSISADVVLVDARQPVGLEDAADAEGGRAREQQDGRGCDQDTRAAGAVAASRRWPGLGGRRSRGAVERRVLGKDRVLQAPQLAARLDADLLDQHGARLAVGLEGLRLAPAAVQREHPPGVQAARAAGTHRPARRARRSPRRAGRRARSASIASSAACSRSPSSRRISGAANGSSATSASASPRHSASASRARAVVEQVLEPHRVDVAVVRAATRSRARG